MALGFQEKNRQILTRRFLKARDQHGRIWGANIHTETQHPVDAVTPDGWTAPYLPDPKYRIWRYDMDNGGHSVFLDYDADIRDRKLALKEWTENMMRIGMQMNGSSFDARRPSPEVLHIVGPKPAAVEIPMAAQAGEPWILGRAVPKPRWAQAFFPDVAPDPLAFLKMTDDEDETEVAAPVAVTKAAPRKRRKTRTRSRATVTKAAPPAVALATASPE